MTCSGGDQGEERGQGCEEVGRQEVKERKGCGM